MANYLVSIDEHIRYSTEMSEEELLQLIGDSHLAGRSLEEFIGSYEPIADRSALDSVEEHLQRHGDVQSSKFTFTRVD